MNNLQSTASPPMLVIDLKKNRLRIHRHTLQLLDNPEYVQFLVNPSDRMIAVRRCKEHEILAQRIRWNLLHGTKQCCEFYSKDLMESLHKLCFDMKDAHSYRIAGTVVPKEQIITFDMNNPVLIQEDFGVDNDR